MLIMLNHKQSSFELNSIKRRGRKGKIYKPSFKAPLGFLRMWFLEKDEFKDGVNHVYPQIIRLAADRVSAARRILYTLLLLRFPLQ